MKRLLVAVVVLSFVFTLLGTAGAWAGSGSGGTKSTTHETSVQTKVDTRTETSTETHRYVKGRAEVQLGPNFLDNDWDGGGLGACTAAEKAYLKTLKGLKAKTWYYVDMTGHTVQTSPFHDHTDYKGSRTEHSKTETTTSWDQIIQVGDFTIGTVTHIVTNVVNTIITVKEYNKVTYQLVASVHDNSPLVLDLDQDKLIDTARHQWMPHAPKFFAETARFFDITGDGAEDLTEWMTAHPKDALLVMPENGKVDTALQLFGTAGGFRDGFEKLAIVCDKDGNGWIEGKELEGLSLWIDANQDARCHASEVRPLTAYGVTRLSVDHNKFVGRYQTKDGKDHVMWDWWPAAVELRKVAVE